MLHLVRWRDHRMPAFVVSEVEIVNEDAAVRYRQLAASPIEAHEPSSNLTGCRGSPFGKSERARSPYPGGLPTWVTELAAAAAFDPHPRVEAAEPQSAGPPSSVTAVSYVHSNRRALSASVGNAPRSPVLGRNAVRRWSRGVPGVATPTEVAGTSTWALHFRQSSDV